MLNINRLHTHYGNIPILKGVSLEVREGEIVTLIGANGAGKSTLLKTISGLIRPSGGEISFLNKHIQGAPPEKIVKMGISHMPEGRRIFSRLTTEENLQMGAFLRSDYQEIAADLESVYTRFPILKERRGQLAGTLSGGEQQMLAIGRSLMAKPALLLMDEPSLGLAPRLVREIFKIIQEINQKGVTILLVEQNAHLALEVASRGYVLETGRIVLSGKASDLAQNQAVQEAYLGG